MLKKINSKQSVAGFTLIEMLVIVVIIGVLGAIAAPSWLGFLNGQRVNAAQSQALGVMRQAQARAKKEKRVWEACFRQTAPNQRVQFATNPLNSSAPQCVNGFWQDLPDGGGNTVSIYPAPGSNTYTIQFQQDGTVLSPSNPPTVYLTLPSSQSNPTAQGKISFIPRDYVTNANSNTSQRCVIVQTILGEMSTAQDTACN